MTGSMMAVSLLMVIGGIGLLSAIAGFVRMVERRRPDPAWKPRTPVQKFSGYDQEKAVAAKQRALELEHSKRKLADMRARPRSDDQEGGGPRLVRLDKKRRTR